MSNTKLEGWKRSDKWHYFRRNTSLCKHVAIIGVLDHSDFGDPDPEKTCEECKRALELSKRPEGWDWLLNSKKWHYFRQGRSLCGRWSHFLDRDNPPADTPDPERRCKACEKQLDKERKRNGSAGS